MKVIVVIACCCPRDGPSLYNVLCIVPLTVKHLIVEVILSFNLRKEFPQSPVSHRIKKYEKAN